MSSRYNVVVIGAGSAGLVSSYVAAALKAKVALIERHKMGGDCLNTGCVPSKALIKTARFIADMRRCQELGVKRVDFEVDFAQVMERVKRVVAEVEPHDSVARYSGLGVECISGTGEILDPHNVRVGGRTLNTKNIIVATGGSPFIPPLKGIDKIKPLTSENLWDIRTLPRRLIVLGGGPIGSEMAQAFARIGSRVTQIEQGPRILPREDDDVAAEIAHFFKKDGVEIVTQTKAKEILIENGEKILVCDSPTGERRIAFDELLCAVGRRANTSGVDWAKHGIELNPNGTIKVDEFLRTTQKNIYACGDVVGPFQFTHTASHQAGYCVINSIFSPIKKFKADYTVIPWVTFVDPEVAQVGLNEQMAKAKNIPYEVTKYGLDDLDRAICESEAHGFVKVLTKPGSDKIIGATIVGHNAGEYFIEFVQAMRQGFGLNGIMSAIHPYPTYAEANRYAAGMWKRAHAPAAGLKFLEWFNRTRR